MLDQERAKLPPQFTATLNSGVDEGVLSSFIVDSALAGKEFGKHGELEALRRDGATD
ncbi:hypothetical protein [Citrifermentans bremense]|uniref:hypothetical protein n=1 Tax=Citrifermentans bremense TaxID=60035 RepID=UPI0012EC2A4A|nr:hypothetical protein [Citrifermentans bremense]